MEQEQRPTKIVSLPLQQSLGVLSPLPMGQLRLGRAALLRAHALAMLLPPLPLLLSRESPRSSTADSSAESRATETTIPFGAGGIARGMPLGSRFALLAFGLALVLLQARPVGRSAAG